VPAVFVDTEGMAENKKNISGTPCGLLRLIAIMVYDGVVIISLMMLAALAAILAGFDGQTAMKDPFYTLYLLSIWFLYLTWCWHKGGMTVGMRAWRVRIEDGDGNRPGWGKASIRCLSALLSVAVVGVGFLWLLVDPHKRTWHDILSNTRLIRC